VTEALGYALVAAAANVLGALAVARGAASSYKVIEPLVAFSAGFMLAVVLTEILPEALGRSGSAAPVLVLLGYLAVHLSQHTVTPHFHFGEETHPVSAGAARSALVGLLLHTFFDGVAIASAFLVGPDLGIVVFVAIFLHKLPEGATISSLTLAAGGGRRRAVLAAAALGLASLLGVALTDRVGFLVRHGLALAGGVTLYVAASNLVPEFQGKRGWQTPLALLAGAAVFFGLHSLLVRALAR
jgi:ZIP family zinc transporter/zinc and cadmium transporter